MKLGKVILELALCALPLMTLSAEPLALRVKDAATIYYQSNGREAFKLIANWTSKDSGGVMNPVAVRLLAPDGEVVDRLETDLAETGRVGLQWQVEVKVPQSGNYRLIWTAFDGDLQVETVPGLPFAFSGHAGGLFLSEGESRFYFVVPPGMEELILQLGGGASLQEIRNQREESVPFAGDGALRVAVSGHAGEVWSLVVAAKSRQASIGFGGAAPVPLALSADAARAVGGAVTVVDGNVICFFPWQVEAWNLLKEYRKLPASAYDVPLPDLAQLASEWEAEPARNRLLFGPGGSYANLKPILAAQNLNPDSRWFGSIDVWRDFDGGKERPLHPVQFYRREEAFGKDFRSGNSLRERRQRGGLGVHQGGWEATNLAAVYELKEKFNPLYRNPALLRRTVIALLQSLMMVRPSELLDPSSTGYYGGNRVFHFTRFTQAWALIGPSLPERERHVIGQGMRAVADRLLVGRVGLTTNQWSFIPVGIYQVYQGSGDERYRDWARRHVTWMLRGGPPSDGVHSDSEAGGGLQPAGYHAESGGPDATYNGLTLEHLALLAREFDDAQIAASVQKSYQFFNHTLVPHPLDSKKPGFGAADYAHRTPGSWWSPQGGGGLVYMADQLPEAGMRAGFGYFSDPRSPDALERFRELFVYNPESFYNDPAGGASRIGGGRTNAWQFFPKAPKKGIYPAEESGEFFRDFGDEFFFAKRGNYYAMVYAGSSKPAWMRSRAGDDILQQFPQNGGGLSLLWSKDAGPFLIGRNLGAYAAHSLIARKGDKEFKNDYWATKVREYKPDEWTLVVEGKMDGLPLAYTRTYRFGADSLEMNLEISATEDVRLSSFQEVLPLAQEKDFYMEAWAGARSVKAEPLEDRSELRLGSSQKSASHRLVLSPPRTVQRASAKGYSYRKEESTIRPLAFDLPVEWKAGQSQKFSATFFFDDPKSVAGK